MTILPLYSPGQVARATLLGGPSAADGCSR
jgi:hypothetical protein